MSVVTARIERFDFLAPAYIGNVVAVDCALNYAGRTSMEVGVEVTAEDLITGEVRHIASSQVIYVALDENGRPTPVPPLVPASAAEKARIARARAYEKDRRGTGEDAGRGRPGMNLLALKLIITPLFVGGATLVARRFGPRVGGWLVGLPLTSGPVVFYLALEQGTGFAARTAQATLLGQVSFATFCLTYRWLSLRSGWPVCWLGSWSAFFIMTFVLQQVSLPLPLTFSGVVGVLLLTLRLLPDSPDQIIKASHPAWDLPGRILVATAFVLLLTGTATLLGPRLSGLLLPLPIYATVIAIFTHHTYGAAAAWQVLRGVVVGSFAYALFFLLIATLIASLGILVAFGCAIAGALLVQGCTLWLMYRQSPLVVH